MKRFSLAFLGITCGILVIFLYGQQRDFFSRALDVDAQTRAALTGPINVGGTDYYVVTSTDPTEDTGDEVCAKVGKACVGYTNLTTDVCTAVNPSASVDNTLVSGSGSGFYCDGAPQGGVCSALTNTCAVCPTCVVGVSCSDPIGGLYREMYVECGADLPLSVSVELNNGITALSTYEDLESQVTGLGSGQGAYTWTVDANNLMRLNLPFNPGATQFDYSGAGNNGTTSGAVFSTSGLVGGAMQFDGVNDYVALGNPSGLNFASAESFSIQVWFKTAGENGGDQIDYFIGKRDVSPYNYAMGITLANSIVGAIYDGVNYVEVTSPSTYNDNLWHQAVFVRDVSSDHLYLYIDGSLVASTIDTTTSAMTTSTQGTLGCAYELGACNPATYFQGLLDEVQIYARALTADQIAQLYNDGVANITGPTSIVSAETLSGQVWDLDVTPFDSDGTVLTPVSSSNTVTITGLSGDVQLNNGVTSLSTYEDLASQVSILGSTQGAYTWTVDASNLMRLNLPFNPGATQFDYSGFANNGTNQNGAIIHLESSGNCKVGACIELDGVNDFVSIPHSSSVNLTSNFTISLWHRNRDTNGGTYMLLSKHNVPTTKSGYTLLKFSDNKYYFQAGDGVNWASLSVATDATYTDFGWHHVVGTFDGTTGNIFVDGVLAGPSDTSNTIAGNTLNLSIGYDISSGVNFTDGFIDEVQIFHRALSPSEVAELYNDGNAGFAGPTKILAEETLSGQVWDLDVTPFEGDGTAMTPVSASNTVTIITPPFTVALNNSVTELYTEADLTSQVTGLGSPQGAYQWTIDGVNLMRMNMPFNAGATQFDYSGHANNGSVNGAYLHQGSSGLCVVGACVEFDGDTSGDSVAIANHASLNVSSFSISGWAKWQSEHPTNVMRTIISRPNNDGIGFNDHFFIYVGDVSKALTARVGHGTSESYVAASTDFSDLGWHHFTLTVDSVTGTLRLYVDGTLEGETLGVPPAFINSQTVHIGKWTQAGGAVHGSWDGFIDEIAFWPSVLTAEQIAHLYADGVANLAGPTTIDSTLTGPGQVWNVSVTPFESNGTAFAIVPSDNTVTIISNGPPTAPSNLFVSASNAQVGATNPIDVATGNPRFSAIYNDPNAGDIADKYRIQVSTTNNFSDIVWDSGASGTTMANCTQGTRCADIVFGGTALVRDGSTYYWRIRYFDQAGVAGAWSQDPTSTNTFTLDIFAGGTSIQRIQELQEQNQQEQELAPPTTEDVLPETTSIAVPIIGPVSVLGPNSIRYEWSYSDPSDILGFRLLNETGAVAVQVDTPTSIAATEESLPHNTLIRGRSVVAYNQDGQSAPSDIYPDQYTEMILVTPRLVSRIGQSIRLAVQEVTNHLDLGLSGIQFELLPADTVAGAQVITGEWTNESVYTFNNTQVDASYLVRSRARNQIALETEWSSSVLIPVGDDAPEQALLTATLSLSSNDGHDVNQPLNPNTVISGEVRITNNGGMSARNVYASLLVPTYVVYIPGTLASNGRAQTDGADGDFAQNGNGYLAAIWPSLEAGQSHTLRFQLGFDTQRLLREFVEPVVQEERLRRGLDLNAIAQAIATANPQISLQAMANHQDEEAPIYSNEYLIQPDVLVLEQAALAQLPPAPAEGTEEVDSIEDVSVPPAQPLTEEQVLIIDQILQEEFPQPGVQTNQTTIPQGETTAEFEGGSFTLETQGDQSSLSLTGTARTSVDQLEFVGTTSEPFTVVTLIFNNSVTSIVVSDAFGNWQTFVSADQLGIAEGASRLVSIEAIAAKGDLRSERVEIAEVTVQRGSRGMIATDFEVTVSEQGILGTIAGIAEQVTTVLQENEPQVQTTLVVSAPVVIVSSAPLWGYLPYAPTLIYHFISWLLGFLGRKKKDEDRATYGVVYDAITKTPLALAIVRVYNSVDNKLAATIVTDKLGRYDALLAPGQYRLEVSKPQYQYPSGIVTSSVDGSFDRIYNKQAGFNVTEQVHVLPHVPVDPVNAKRQWELSFGFKKLWLAFQRAGNLLATPIMVVGFVSALGLVYATPSRPANWVMAGIYALTLASQWKLKPKLIKAWGVVYDVASNAILPLVTIQLIEPATSKVVTSRLSDYEGRFTFLPEPGTYVIKASKTGFEQVTDSQAVANMQAKDRAPLSDQITISSPTQRVSGDVAMKQVG